MGSDHDKQPIKHTFCSHVGPIPVSSCIHRYICSLLFVVSCMIPRTSLKRRIEKALRAPADDRHDGGAASSSDTPRGTIRRRIERGVESGCGDNVSEQSLPLNAKLKKKWASGEMSAIAVQELAEAAQAQGADGDVSLICKWQLRILATECTTIVDVFCWSPCGSSFVLVDQSANKPWRCAPSSIAAT